MLYKIVGAGVLLTVLLAAGVYFLIPRPTDPSSLTVTPRPTPSISAPAPTAEATEDVDEFDDAEDEGSAEDDASENESESESDEQRDDTAPRDTGGPASMSTDRVTAALERELGARAGRGTSVNCPASVPQRSGEVFQCSAHEGSTNGRQLSTVTVTVTDASGRFRWESVPIRN